KTCEVAGIIFAAVVLAGLIQIAMGIFRIGQYIRLVPYPVISGFMSGIGVIIILLQASRLFGSAPEAGGTIAAIQAIPGAILNPDFAATGIAFVALAIVFFWPKAIGKYLPAPLAALIAATLLALPFDIPKLAADLPEFSSFADRLPAFVLPQFDGDAMFLIVQAAVTLAVLGAIDSLLTSLVADNATRTRHDSNKELIGQGIANTIAGLFSAIPGAGATMRTMVNIRTGGMTRISGMVAGLLLLAVVLALTPMAAVIPHAVLAGILIKVGWDIIDFPYILRAHKGPRWDLALMAIVLLVTVFVDLITAVGIGVFLAALGFVHSIAKDQLEAIGSEDLTPMSPEEKAIYKGQKGRIGIFEFNGPLSFGAAADIAHRVRENVSAQEVLILDFAQNPSLDVSAAYAVQSIIEDAEREERFLLLANASSNVIGQLEGLGITKLLTIGRLTMNRLEALQYAEELLSRVERSSEMPASSPSPSVAEWGA
ncbi:MAG: SulP family inorganic anion transporter, partial [Pseudomonadota bacterium]